MIWLKAALLAGLLSAPLVTVVPDVMAAEGRNVCRRGERLRIQDLDMSPDPVFEGQRVRGWKVRIRLDGQRQCETEIVVREGKEVVGRERSYNLKPGVNVVEVPAADGFRFRGREQCFDVEVDLEKSRQRVDADRRFCAQQKTVWSMSKGR
jgi:hypothetical protein